jgi:hypothetical protein
LTHRKPVTQAMIITQTRCTSVEPSARERDMPGTFDARKLQQQQHKHWKQAAQLKPELELFFSAGCKQGVPRVMVRRLQLTAWLTRTQGR